MSKSSSSRTSRKDPAATGVNDTRPAKGKKPKKPKKPRPDFPLFPHASGRWAKKVKGEMHYFGYWARRKDGALVRVEGDGWEEAKKEYDRVIDAIQAGRARPKPEDDGLTVGDLCNRFLTAKLRKVEADELTPRLFAEYKEVAQLCVGQFGAGRLVDDLGADDFAQLRATMAKKWGPVRIGNSITRTKSVFKFGYETGLMERPVRYGPEFVKPDKAVLRRHRAKKPAKMFEAEEVRAMIDGKDCRGEGEGEPRIVKADVTLRAMILLGVNCGFGNTDCAELTFTGLDLEGGWIEFPRPKTGIARRCPLWPETVAAIKAAAAIRPKPSGYPECGRVFLTTRGNAFVTHTPIAKAEDGDIKGGARKDLIGIQFTKLLDALGFRREGVGFYSLRHVFETVAGEAKDQVAVDLIMGHTDHSMAAHYRERVEDQRLKDVAEHVRKWLFTEKPAQ
jgi:integrase